MKLDIGNAILTVPQLVKAKQLSQMCAIDISQVYSLPIPYVKVGKRGKRWDVRDVEAYLNEMKVRQES